MEFKIFRYAESGAVYRMSGGATSTLRTEKTRLKGSRGAICGEDALQAAHRDLFRSGA